jgi:hypothetical protein
MQTAKDMEVPQTIPITSFLTEDINEYCEMIHEYQLRLSDVEDTYNRLLKKLNDCFQFLDDINIPFSHEYIKLIYTNTFETYLNVLFTIRMHFEEFPQIVESMCLLALSSQRYLEKKKCQTYLDALMSWYNVSLAHLEDDVEKCANQGLKAHNHSKVIKSRCS